MVAVTEHQESVLNIEQSVVKIQVALLARKEADQLVVGRLSQDPHRRQELGISVIHLAVDDIPITAGLADQLDTDGSGVVEDDEVLGLLDPAIYDQIQYETDRELALLLSYGRRAGAWQWGGNLKFIRQAVADYSSFGVGIDLGVLRRDWVGRLDFGVKLQDATKTYLSWDTGRNETIAPVLVPGISYDWLFESLHLGLLGAAAF